MESSEPTRKESDGCLPYILFGFLPFLAGYPLGELARLAPWAPFVLLLLGAACWSGFYSRGQEKWVFPAPGTGVCVALIVCGFGVWVLQTEELREATEECPSYDLAEIERPTNPRRDGQGFLPRRFGLAGPMMALYPLSRQVRVGKDGRGYAYPIVSRQNRLYSRCLQGEPLRPSESGTAVVWVLGSKGDFKRKPEIVVGPLWLRQESWGGAYEIAPNPFRGARSRFLLACLLAGLGLVGLVLVPLRKRLAGRVAEPPPSLPPLRD